MISFIHTADLHLDSPFKGLSNVPGQLLEEIQEASFKAFEHLVTQAIDKKVDFMLIVGDLFDLNTRSIRAQAFLRQQFERLNNKSIQVFITYGNHDFVGDEKLYLNFPKNVTVFGEDVETFIYQSKNRETVSITGFSYHTRHISTSKIKEFSPKSDQTDYHIGMYHGDITQNSTLYAPFEWDDVSRLHYDYMALGHIHQAQKIANHIPAYYSGCIQGRHINETGEKGAYYVELNGPSHESTFIPTSMIDWHSLIISINEKDTLDSVINQIKNEFGECKKSVMVRLILELENEESIQVGKLITPDHLNQLLIEQNIWLISVETVLNDLKPIPDMYKESLDVATQVVLDKKMDDYLKELLKQVQPKLLKEFKDRDRREDIIQKALNKLASKT